MFSENGLISEKQMRRMIIMPCYASLIFVIPHLSAKQFDKNLVPGLAAFFLFAVIYVGFLWRISGRISERVLEGDGLVRKASKIAGKGFAVWNGIRFSIRSAFYVSLSIAVLCEGEVPYASKYQNRIDFLVVIPLLVICIYGASRNLEKQGRICELLFWLLFIPFVFVVLFGIRGMNFKLLQSSTSLSLNKMCESAYGLLPFLLPAEYLLFLRSHLRKGERSRWSFLATVGTVLLVLVLSLGMIALYGVNGSGNEPLLTVAIMRCIKLPFQLTQRVDALLIWFFLVGCFVLISQTLFWAKEMFLVAIPGWKTIGSFSVILGTVLFFVFWMPEYEKMLFFYQHFAMWFEIPSSLLYPLLVKENKMQNGWKKWSFLLVCIVLGASLSGCKKRNIHNDMRNVEERDYATVLLLEQKEENEALSVVLGIARERRVGENSVVEQLSEWKADNLKDLQNVYENRMGKDLSLAHLKVIVCDDIPCRNLIFQLDQENEIAKTCPLLILDEGMDFKNYMEKSEGPVGNYIDRLIRMQEKQGNRIAWLLDYRKAWEGDGQVLSHFLRQVNDELEIIAGDKIHRNRFVQTGNTSEKNH